MKRLWLLALIGAVLLSGSAAWADSEFYVIAAGPTAVGTKITSVPYTISTPGFYYLTGNLTYNGNGYAAITVNADNVTIDLMGFSLTYTGSSQVYGIGIWGRMNVEVRNGTICGFYCGVAEPFETGANHRVNNVRAVSNTILGAYGIGLYGKNHLVQNCNCSNNNQVGIFVNSGVITNSVACDNVVGIRLKGPGSVIGNIANNNTGYNFQLGTFNTKTPIMVDRNSASGLSLNYFVESGSTGIIWSTNAGSP